MKNRFIIISLLAVLFGAGSVFAREIRPINRNWKFYIHSERDSVSIDLPHTWNSGVLGAYGQYYRGTGNYVRYVDVLPRWQGKRLFVKFHGASAVTELIVNGRYAGSHFGGNNAFVFEITDLVDYGHRNFLWVKVSNSWRSDVLPTAGPGNVYGGIFRDAELIVTDRNAIGIDEYGSPGVEITMQKANASAAECRVNVKINVGVAAPADVAVTVYDAEGNEVERNNTRAQLKKGMSEVSVPVRISSPRMWHGTEDPYLYRFAVEITGEAGGTDRVELYGGLRRVEIGGEGFMLNGERYPVRGVVLHRDRALYGPVSMPWQIDADLDIIQEMGANAVRVAYGTHSQYFYEECDRRGIVVINDLPLGGAATLDTKGFYNTEAFKNNARRQLSELVIQNYNHPSVIAWNIFAEPEIAGDDPVPFIRELNGLCKSLDPTRPTSGCSSADGDINAITDAIVWNHILGWETGFPSDIAIWRNQLFSHGEWGRLRSAVSYRCGGSVIHQSESPGRVSASDSRHPESYQTFFHETYMREVGSDDRFWGIFVGDMFDFASAATGFRGEPDNMEDCGLATFDRAVRKDAFYLYKANWNTREQFVYITGRRLPKRGRVISELHVYSNRDEVELFVNGVSQGAENGIGGVFSWKEIELAEGVNEIRAVAGDCSDSYRVTATGPGTL